MAQKKPCTLITGSAKRIGAAIAQHLAASGHDLVLHYHRSRGEAEALDAELKTQGCTVTLAPADLENVAGLEGFWQDLPPVTNLIHNASSYARDPFAKFTAAQLRQHLATNLEAPLLLSQGFLAQLASSSSGSIIVLGDGALGSSIGPNFFPYAVSKHAWSSVIALLAMSVAPQARANMLALGPSLQGPQDSDGLFARLAEHAPLKRTGSVEEVLRGIDFLLASPGVTGQVISLANGMGLAE